MPPLVAVILATAVAALLLTPLVARVAHAWGVVDRPGLRKVHGRPVAYLGGVAVFGALICGCGALWLLARDPVRAVGDLDPRVWAILGGATLMFVVGLVDDVRHLRARTKLVVQLVAAGLVFASGVSIDGLVIADGVQLEFGIFSAVVTVLWIVGVTNAVNFIDGLDGLASGICAIAAAAIAWTAFQTGHVAAGFLMAGLMGAVLGFLPYNIHPARVFLGDAGSLVLGFLLSSTAALTATKAPTLVGLGVPLVALGIPILDTLFSMMRRVIERRSMMSPDKNHIHHRLMALGYGQPRTVMTLCAVTAMAVVMTMVFAKAGNLERLYALGAALGLYVLVFRMSGAVRIKESMAAVSRVASVAREETDHRQLVDELELRLAESGDVDAWWEALTRAADALRFDRLALDLEERTGGVRRLRWRRPGADRTPEQPVPARVTVPVRGRRAEEPLQVEAEVAQADSLEAVGRRVSMLCRLLDRHSLATVASSPRERGVVERRQWPTPA